MLMEKNILIISEAGLKQPSLKFRSSLNVGWLSGVGRRKKENLPEVVQIFNLHLHEYQ